jgi:hypothetical protein
MYHLELTPKSYELILFFSYVGFCRKYSVKEKEYPLLLVSLVRCCFYLSRATGESSTLELSEGSNDSKPRLVTEIFQLDRLSHFLLTCTQDLKVLGEGLIV